MKISATFCVFNISMIVAPNGRLQMFQAATKILPTKRTNSENFCNFLIFNWTSDFHVNNGYPPIDNAQTRSSRSFSRLASGPNPVTRKAPGGLPTGSAARIASWKVNDPGNCPFACNAKRAATSTPAGSVASAGLSDLQSETNMCNTDLFSLHNPANINTAVRARC